MKFPKIYSRLKVNCAGCTHEITVETIDGKQEDAVCPRCETPVVIRQFKMDEVMSQLDRRRYPDESP